MTTGAKKSGYCPIIKDKCQLDKCMFFFDWTDFDEGWGCTLSLIGYSLSLLADKAKGRPI